ncbi:PepSY-associated TM helix domain-containing protein [Neiella sp. HB171785]|uniref:PepSY-associated TM helix domain-containing protein n=1 Tax=Neiella litorisoli TaxID=2771431 RepID=A0A8J6UF90_9GAMM|nr:PepSY-associated TM helix domain-containing protein [Neiella litorisoli]
MFSLCRWLHIYVSCALFSLLLFFAVTGITLNHPHWAATPVEHLQQLPLPPQLLVPVDGELPLHKLQRHIEQLTGLESPRRVDVDLALGEITYDFPVPAGYAFVTVLTDSQQIEIEYQRGRLLALLNDLHKGRHSGASWSWLIDISAGLMVLFAVTGIVILLQNAKHRNQAWLLVLLGTATPCLLYLCTVPRLL